MPGETVLGHSYRNFPGGKGANQAVACARAGGAPTQFVGAFGEDSLAEPIRSSLQTAGVTLYAVSSQDLPTGTAFICVAANGENAITVVPGANTALRPEHMPALKGISYLLLQLETPLETVQAYARQARNNGVPVALNAAPADAAARGILPDIDVLIVNEGELALLSETKGSIVAQMQALPVETVVTTLGARGCVAKTPGGYVAQPAFAVTVVDTTAAGDTFCGVLVAELGRGSNLPSALALASAAGALACTRPGAQSSIPERAEVLGFHASAPTPTAAQMSALHHYCGL